MDPNPNPNPIEVLKLYLQFDRYSICVYELHSMNAAPITLPGQLNQCLLLTSPVTSSFASANPPSHCIFFKVRSFESSKRSLSLQMRANVISCASPNGHG